MRESARITAMRRPANITPIIVKKMTDHLPLFIVNLNRMILVVVLSPPLNI